MDGYLAVVGKREVRRYEARAIPDEVLTQILEAGRAAGSSRNRQPWRFVVVTDPAHLQDVSRTVSRPGNVSGSTAAVAIALTTGRAAFDAGRAAQNMMIAAWALGVGTCPNTPLDEAAAKATLGLPAEFALPTILSLGYPARGEPRPHSRRDPADVLRRVNRLPLDQLVFRDRYTGEAAR